MQLPQEVATARRRRSRKATRTRASESPWPGECRSTNGPAHRRTLGGDFLGQLRLDGKDLLTLETKASFESALARLRRRDPEAMAAFILSLAQVDGAVGEQVRTFIVGDDVTEAGESLRQRLRSLESPSEYHHRHALGEGIGQDRKSVV